MTDLGAIFRRLPRLVTPRLVLRPLEAGDAEAVFAYARDEEVARYVSWRCHRTIDDARQFVQRMLGAYAAGRPGTWALEHRAAAVLIGTAGLANVNFATRVGEVGYVLARPYWGQGLATEALREIIRFAITELDLERIEGRCHADHIASARVMEKCGMLLERRVEPGPLLADQLPAFRLYAINRFKREN